MRICIIISSLLLINPILGYIYQLKPSLTWTLRLLKEGYIAKPSEFPSIFAAIEDRSRRFEELNHNWGLLVRAMKDNELFDSDGQFIFMDVQKNLGDFLKQRLVNGDLERLVMNLLDKANELCNGPVDPSDELKKQIIELGEQWDLFISSKDFNPQQMWLDEVHIGVEVVHNRLSYLYEPNRENFRIVDKLGVALSRLDVLIEKIGDKVSKTPPDTPQQFPKVLKGLISLLERMELRDSSHLEGEDLKALRRLKPLFGETSMLHQYIDKRPSDALSIIRQSFNEEEDLGDMDLLGLVGRELRDFAIRDRHNVLIFLEGVKNFHSFRGFRNGSSYYPYKVHFRNKTLSSLVIQLAYHLKGLDRPELFSEIYEAHKNFGKMESHDQNALIQIFKVYLWSFKDNPKNRQYLEKFILSNETSKAQLKELIRLNFENGRPLPGYLKNNINNLQGIADVDKIIGNFAEKIAMSKSTLLFDRKAHLGYIGSSGKFEEYIKDEGPKKFTCLKGRLASAHLKEISEYFKKEEIVLNAANTDKDLESILRRLSRIYDPLERITGPVLLPYKPVLEFVVAQSRAMYSDDPKDHLGSFYHRYIFPELDLPVNQIQQNIDEIIGNLKLFIKAMVLEGFINDFEIGKVGGDKSLIELYMELVQFLLFLKEHFDLILSFPGVKLSPFERRLYVLAKQIYFVSPDAPNDDIMPKNDKDWEKISTVFQEWLLLLETWKGFIETYVEQEDILDPNFELRPSVQINIVNNQ